MDIKSELATRREQLAKMLSSLHGKAADAMILLCRDGIGWQDIYYYTGFMGSAGAMLYLGGEFSLIVDRRYADDAQALGTLPVSVCGGEMGSAKSPLETAIELMTNAKAKRAAYAGTSFPHNVVRAVEGAIGPGAELIDVSPFIFSARRKKSANECDMIAKAARIASAAYEQTVQDVGPGMTEREFASMLAYRMNVGGADFFSPPPIMVTSGERTYLPHAVPSGRQFRRGDLVMVDFCTRAAGYVCDMTRMFCIGEAPPDVVRLYSALRWAQASASMTLHPGAKGTDPDAAARAVLESVGAEVFFTHGTGHGIGLSVHEPPAISQSSSVLLAEGDTVTIEPGLYIPGRFGMRVEDDYLITKNGVRCITEDLSRELRVV